MPPRRPPRQTLADALAAQLPAGQKFQFHHASTIPASCPALYSPPPGQKPEKTYCETQLLHVSISPCHDFARDTVAVFAIEVYVYTTARLTTVFVSKADSTGYAPLLALPPGAPSVVKGLGAGFLSWLIRQRTRPDRPLVLSLFARAQEQYLFPGSAENKTKHVLDDRQLVKWWCRTLDPILRDYPAEQDEVADDEDRTWSQAYLIVPGQDKYETTAFYPPSARADPLEKKRWKNGDPLRQISSHPTAPPRCLVPHYPDDPKARFLMDLDEELQNVPPSQQVHEESPSKRGNGHWKSVKTLEQFWELMAFRQECCSGRLTGFLWIVFMPDGADKDEDDHVPPSPSLKPHILDSVKLPHPGLELAPAPALQAQETPKKQIKPVSKRKTPRRKLALSTGTAKREQLKKRKKAKLRGPIIPRPPRVKRSFNADPASLRMPETTKYYHCPLTSRGSILVDQKAYNRIHEILTRLDYANHAIAKASTFKWINESAIVAGQAGRDWGVEIVGRKPVEAKPVANGAAPVTTLAVKRKAPKDPPAEDTGSPSINNLAAGMIRKKAKTQDAPTVEAPGPGPGPEPGPEPGKGTEGAQGGVHALSTALIRKKAKP